MMKMLYDLTVRSINFILYKKLLICVNVRVWYLSIDYVPYKKNIKENKKKCTYI